MTAVYNLQKQLYPDGPGAEKPAAILVKGSSGDKTMETKESEGPRGQGWDMVKWQRQRNAWGLDTASATFQRGELNLASLRLSFLRKKRMMMMTMIPTL